MKGTANNQSATQHTNAMSQDRAVMHKPNKHTKHHMAAPKVTPHPLTDAFEQKYGIHAGMMDGKKVDKEIESLWVDELNVTPSNQSAMAYIHIPFCCTRCLFCGFYAEASAAEAMSHYTDLLLEEISAAGQRLKRTNQSLSAIYLGGGTPTDLAEDDLCRLLRAIRFELPLTSDCEITLEGRLYGFNDHKLRTALDNGVNRFSFGVQSFNTEIRQRLGRRLNHGEIIGRLNRIVELSEPYQAAVVIDLIYGLPGQGSEEWLADINCAIEETNIHGLDLYQINVIQGTPLANIRERLPEMANLQQQGQLFSQGRERMIGAGFDRLSVAHWGRSTLERNRYNSWNKLGVNCLPLGCGAGGRWGKSRFFQTSDMDQYCQKVLSGEKPLAMAMVTPDYTPIISLAIGELEQQQLDISKLEQLANRPLHHKLLPMLEQWEKAGLLNLRASKPAMLTEAGEFWNVNLQQLLTVQLKEILCQ